MANDTRQPGIDGGSPFPPTPYLPQWQESAGAERESRTTDRQGRSDRRINQTMTMESRKDIACEFLEDELKK